MALKPWYKVVTPREDLCEGKPLDASEFAVHLDQVRDGRAPSVYQEPKLFFDRTYLTQNLTGMAAEVIRRLSGEVTETSAVFNMSTQFGGGKTHALTLLYHLAKNGPEAASWNGVNKLLTRAGVQSVPAAATAVFVGTEFDSITGRGGHDGTPLRKTPWGEIAYQLGGAQNFEIVAEHEKQMTAPAGDVIRRILPDDKPCLILMDELMNYVSRSRKSGMAAQLYNFIQNLSEEVRGRKNALLAVSIPASELEMNAEDQSDYERFKKMLDRLGKPVIMSAETETSEIIRRRLFEWGGIPDDAKKTINEYSDWVIDHRHQLPSWFPIDNARDAFAATYPFHPMVFSVFERKWQALPRFQRTRGVLRLLALWVARAYQDGFKGTDRDPLIGLGTAPLDDTLFRAALFEQLGEPRLEVAVTADICGKKDSHAVRLDAEASDIIKKARLHKKVATSIFFESNGGQLQAYSTLPEIRMAVATPDFDSANIETALEALVPPNGACFYMDTTKNRYWFSIKPNLLKLLADRRTTIQQDPDKVQKRIHTEIQKLFKSGPAIERIYFPEKSTQIQDRPAVTLVVLSPQYSLHDERTTMQHIDSMTRECGGSARTFKSALIWAVAENASLLYDEATKVLAWEAISEEQDELHLDPTQQRQLTENQAKSRAEFQEAIWRTYKNIVLLGADNTLRKIDLGLIHSSSAETLPGLMLNRLRQNGDVEDSISPNFLLRNWPPAFTEWSTKSVRDAFFASPQFPRILNAEAIKDTIARGVTEGLIAYVGTDAQEYKPFYFGTAYSGTQVEISDAMFIVTKDVANAYVSKQTAARAAATSIAQPVSPPEALAPDHKGQSTTPSAGDASTLTATKTKVSAKPQVTTLRWSGGLPSQKWMNFYTKVLSKFASGSELKLKVTVEVVAQDGLSDQQVQDTRIALQELALDDTIDLS